LIPADEKEARWKRWKNWEHVESTASRHNVCYAAAAEVIDALSAPEEVVSR
jgi:hypothetical protein